MTGGPDLDGRRRDDLREHLEDVAPAYVDAWDPEGEDVGSALVALFSDMAGGLVERLDELPAKHRAAFVEALGFDRRPPQPATVPVCLALDEEAPGPLAIEAGTEFEATDAAGETVTLRIDREEAFEATPARLREVYSVDPDSNGLFAHHGIVDGEESSTLFSGTDRQTNALYLRHDEALDVSAGANVVVELETDADPEIVSEGLRWEYFGEPAAGEERSEEGEARWRELAEPVESPADALRTAIETELRTAASVVDDVLDDREAHTREALLEELRPTVTRAIAAVLAGNRHVPTPDDVEASLEAFLAVRLRRFVRTKMHRAFADGESDENGVATLEEELTEAVGDVLDELVRSDLRAQRRIVGPAIDPALRHLDDDALEARVSERLRETMLESVLESAGSGTRDVLEAVRFGVVEACRLATLEGLETAHVERLDEFATLAAVVRDAALASSGGTDEPLEPAVERAVSELLGRPIAPGIDRRRLGERRTSATTIDEGVVRIERVLPGAVAQTAVDDREGRWIRCRAGSDGPAVDELDVTISEAAIATVPPQMQADALLANDVPQATGADVEPVTPFGERPRLRDAFSVASEEVFTKRGAIAAIDFETASDLAETIETALAGMPDQHEALGRGLAGLPGVVAFARSHVYGAELLARGLLSARYGARVLEGAFGGPVEDDPADDDAPTLSWEYFDGETWQRLPGRSDGTDALRSGGTVSFAVPEDVAPTAIDGEDGVWIRVRLVGGGYVEEVFEGVADPEADVVRRLEGEPPRFTSVTLGYEYPEPVAPTAVVAENNGEYEPLSFEDGPVRPFDVLPDREQGVYLGFDRALSGGPVQLYVEVADRTYPDGFSPRIAWEYCVDPERDEWARLGETDGTDGLAETGLLSLTFPEETTAFERFDRERHWIRARVRGDRFEPTAGDDGREGGDEPEETVTESDDDVGESNGSCGADGDADDAERDDHERCLPCCGGRDREPCSPTIGTEPPGTFSVPLPPTLEGVYGNAGLAAHVVIVEDEPLGSSDGSPGQTVVVDEPPAIDVEVWVDERTALSTREAEALASERPADVELERDSEGELRAAWVRWAVVDSLAPSGADDRHVVVDRVAGEIGFGDDDAGRIPPPGRDNLRASYRTGGGPEGNLPAGAVEDLVDASPLVEAVTNRPGSAGAPAETTASVLERAPKTLRDRGRAVTRADLERVAMDASRRLARVRCVPGMNETGAHEPGVATLLIVPNDGGETPVPDPGLRRRVREAVAERAPATVRANDRLVVRGPTYVSVSADAAVVTDGTESLGIVETRLDDRLTAFFHPLLGGPNGDGWPFGDLPTAADVLAALERCRGVDHVADLRLTYADDRETVTVLPGEAVPAHPPDVLVESGGHEFALEPREAVREVTR